MPSRLPFTDRPRMSQLLLKRASASRPSGQWRDDDYDALEDGVVVGPIFCFDAVGPRGRPWMWASGHNGHIRRAAVWLTATPSQFARLAIRSLLRSRTTRRNPRLQSLGPHKPKRRVADLNVRRGWRGLARELSPSTSSSAASQMHPSLMKRLAIQRSRRRSL
jgi:hypothetical protein